MIKTDSNAHVSDLVSPLSCLSRLGALISLVSIISLSNVLTVSNAALAADVPIYVSTTIDRGPSDSLSSAERLANVPFNVYVNGALTQVSTTTTQAPGGSTSADTFGLASTGDQVVVCLAGEVDGYSFESIRLNAIALADPAGLDRPCGGLSSVGTSATSVPVSFNFKSDVLIYVSTTIDRGAGDSISSADRLANVPFNVYVNSVLTLVSTTTTQSPGGSTSADTFGLASVGDEVIVCLAGEVDGYTFESIRLNANLLVDPAGLDRPCGGLASVSSTANSVPISFNFKSDVLIYVSTTIDRGASESLSSADRLANVPFNVYINDVLTLVTTTTTQSPGGSTSADTFGFASLGDEVIVCLAGEVEGYTFESIRLNANPLSDPAGLDRPCAGLANVGSTANSVPISFNFKSDVLIYVSATIDRGPSQSLSSAERLANVPLNVYVNSILTLVSTTTTQPPGGSTSADTFGFASVGDEVIVCLDDEVLGYTFESIRLNANSLVDPAGLDRPCGGLSSVGSSANSVPISFNFTSYPIIPCNANIKEKHLPQESADNLKWYLISIPCNSPTFATMADFIGDASITDQPKSWAAFIYLADNAGGRYERLTASSKIPRAGTGLWFITSKDATLTMPDGSVQAPLTDKSPCDNGQPCHVQTIKGKSNWNLIGNPFDTNTTYDEILLTNEDVNLGCAEFTPCSLGQPSITSAVYFFDSNNQKYLKYGNEEEQKSVAATWDGYWAIFLSEGIGDDWQLYQKKYQSQYMFVTDNLFNGNLGGLDGADAVCQNEADNAALAGKYQAWLS